MTLLARGKYNTLSMLSESNRSNVVGLSYAIFHASSPQRDETPLLCEKLTRDRQGVII